MIKIYFFIFTSLYGVYSSAAQMDCGKYLGSEAGSEIRATLKAPPIPTLIDQGLSLFRLGKKPELGVKEEAEANLVRIFHPKTLGNYNPKVWIVIPGSGTFHNVNDRSGNYINGVKKVTLNSYGEGDLSVAFDSARESGLFHDIDSSELAAVEQAQTWREISIGKGFTLEGDVAEGDIIVKKLDVENMVAYYVTSIDRVDRNDARYGDWGDGGNIFWGLTVYELSMAHQHLGSPREWQKYVSDMITRQNDLLIQTARDMQERLK